MSPVPSSPSALSPQQRTFPDVLTEQLCAPPAATALMDDPRPTTSTGTGLPIVVPSPSSPEAFPPQHFTAPSVVTAQACVPPIAGTAAPKQCPVPSQKLPP